MKKIKCIKCELYFKDRQDPKDDGTVNASLCWNCRFVWQVIGMVLQGLPIKINRDVKIDFDDVSITRKRHDR